MKLKLRKILLAASCSLLTAGMVRAEILENGGTGYSFIDNGNGTTTVAHGEYSPVDRKITVWDQDVQSNSDANDFAIYLILNGYKTE